jgi:hypothetical protein
MTDNRLVALPGRRAPEGLARQLRELADAADRGELTALVASYTVADRFGFLYAAGHRDGVLLSAWLHQECMNRLTEDARDV